MKINNIGAWIVGFCAALTAFATHSADAGDYAYAGARTFFCDPSLCNQADWASATGTLTGSVSINVAPGSSFTAADVSAFSFELTDPTLPFVVYDGSNPLTANPLPLDGAIAVVEATSPDLAVTTGGETNSDGDVVSGNLLLRFTSVLNGSNTWLVLDLATGEGLLCALYGSNPAGCRAAGGFATALLRYKSDAFAVQAATVQLYAGGSTTACTEACASVAALAGPPGVSHLEGGVMVNFVPNSNFGAEDFTGFNFAIFNEAAPIVPFDGGNAATANPLPIDPSTAVIEANNLPGTFGTSVNTDATGSIVSGTILLRLTFPPFNANNTWMVVDVATGLVRLCLLFDSTECQPGTTEAAAFRVPWYTLPDTGIDSDGDGIENDNDNCIDVANADQFDSNGDTIGNACDGDLNNDCQTNLFDLVAFKAAFGSGGAANDADFNGDNNVNLFDLVAFKGLFGRPPGPSASGVCP